MVESGLDIPIVCEGLGRLHGTMGERASARRSVREGAWWRAVTLPVDDGLRQETSQQ